MENCSVGFIDAQLAMHAVARVRHKIFLMVLRILIGLSDFDVLQIDIFPHAKGFPKNVYLPLIVCLIDVR